MSRSYLLIALTSFVFFIVNRGTDASAVDDPRQEILATFEGGQITRSDLESGRPVLAGTGTPLVESRQVRQLAIYRFLSERVGDRGPDRVLQMRLLAAEAAIFREQFLKDRKSKLVVPEYLIERQLESTRGDYARPEQRRIRNIFKNTAQLSSGDALEVHKKLEELRTLVINGADFAALAFKESDSSNRLDGGLIGSIRRGALSQEIEEIIFNLDEGDVSAVTRYGNGLHLFFCERIDEPRNLSDEEIRGRIRESLAKKMLSEDWKSLSNLWVAEAKFNAGALNSVDTSAIVFEIEGHHSFTNAEVGEFLKSLGKFEVASETEREDQIKRLIVSLRSRYEYERNSDVSPQLRDLVDWMRRRLLAENELEREFKILGDFPAINEDVLRNTYESQREELISDPTFLLESLALRIDPEQLPSDTARLQALRDHIIANPDETMASFAKENFPATTLERIRVVPPEWQTELSIRGIGRVQFRSFKELEIGEVSPIFRTIIGGPTLWTLKLHESEEPRQISYEEARPGLKRYHEKRNIESRRLRVEAAVLESMNFQVPR